MQVLDARRDTTGGYKVDVSRGERVGRVSSEWFSRPADERYLSLSELARPVRDRADRSRSRVVESALIHVEAETQRSGAIGPDPARHRHSDCADTLVLRPACQPGRRTRRLSTTAPGRARWDQPAIWPDIHRAEQIKTLETDDGRTELRTVTGPDYGRIFDAELVEAVQRITGNGTGDTRWKVPGLLDWSTGVYNALWRIRAYKRILPEG